MGMMMEEGYETSVSMPVRVLIDEWEARLVTEHLAKGRGGGQINHYWLIKNMILAYQKHDGNLNGGNVK